MSTTNNYNALFTELEAKISTDTSNLAQWSKNYFNNHKKRYKNDIRIINSNYVEGEILEIGSAPYHLTYILTKYGYPLTGIDIEPERQKNFISQNKLNIIKCNIEEDNLPFKDEQFKYIIFNEIFEHLRINPIKTLKEIRRVLHPSGILILSTPNLYSINNIINFFIGRGFDNPYEQFIKLETLGHMGHVREYSVNQVKLFLQNTGYKVIQTKRKSFTPLKGLWKPFNIFRKLFPLFNSVQIHICKKG